MMIEEILARFATIQRAGVCMFDLRALDTRRSISDGDRLIPANSDQIQSQIVTDQIRGYLGRGFF
jgi:hypothetical protein